MRRHWRLFVPTWLGGSPTRLTWRQRVHHGNHGLDVACIGLRAVALGLSTLAAFSMAVQHERIAMPLALYVAATAVLFSSTALRLLVYRRSVGATLAQALGGTVAFAALNHIIVVASLKALLGFPARWERTNKFPVGRRRLGVLADSLTESSIAAVGIVTSAALFLISPGGLITMFAIAAAGLSLMYLTSPALALIADKEIRTAEAPDRASVLQH